MAKLWSKAQIQLKRGMSTVEVACVSVTIHYTSKLLLLKIKTESDRGERGREGGIGGIKMPLQISKII